LQLGSIRSLSRANASFGLLPKPIALKPLLVRKLRAHAAWLTKFLMRDFSRLHCGAHLRKGGALWLPGL
jgi:hypothetical protein